MLTTPGSAGLALHRWVYHWQQANFYNVVGFLSFNITEIALFINHLDLLGTPNRVFKVRKLTGFSTIIINILKNILTESIEEHVLVTSERPSYTYIKVRGCVNRLIHKLVLWYCWQSDYFGIWKIYFTCLRQVSESPRSLETIQYRHLEIQEYKIEEWLPWINCQLIFHLVYSNLPIESCLNMEYLIWLWWEFDLLHQLAHHK